VGWDLNLSGCTSLASLPKGLHVGRNLNLSGCTSLTSLPEGLHVGWGLNLSGCTSLASLPEGLHVGWDLNLSGCTSLTSLPEGLYVGYNLNLSGCTSLASLPEGLQLGMRGPLDLSGCTSLTSLPSWITQLGSGLTTEQRYHVYLENTGLSENILTRLRQTNAPGMQFHFSQRASVSKLVFMSLQEAFEFWNRKANKSFSLPKPIFTPEELTYVLDFLSRLTTTAEYKNSSTQPILAGRVLKAFQLMEENDDIKQQSYDKIYHGLTSCDDRIISALDEIELLVKLYELENSTMNKKDLREIGKSYFFLEKVGEKVNEHKKTLGWVDEIEVSLAFQTELTKRFKLPISTENMIFRRCAGATKEQIQAYGDAIEKEYTEEKLDNFLKIWSPWLKHCRREEVPPYKELESISSVKKEHECCILGVETDTPVEYGGNVYAYNAFVKLYLDNGQDPFTRKPIDLSQLKRVVST